MTYAVAGVSGNTGKVVAETLLAAGKKVRVIVRDSAKGQAWAKRGAEVAVADLADSSALTRALQDAEGAYLLVPPSFTATDYRAHQDDVSRALAAAVKDSAIPHVVLLSSVGAQHEKGTGPIAGLHYTETLLRQIPGVALSSLRAGYFYDNLAASLAAAKDAGVLPVFFPAQLAFPMVSTGDIGRLAASLLLEGAAKSQIVDLGTSHTVAEIAAVVGRLLGKSVEVQEAPLEAVGPALIGAGLSADLAGLYAEMTAGVHRGLVVFAGGSRHVESTEPLEKVFATLLK